jgi:mono/diheme cytochrome c family protein
LTVVLIGAGVVEYEPKPVMEPVTAPPQVATAEYGRYMVSFSDCRDCHGQDLQGGKPPAPVGPSLQVVKGWTQEQFVKTIRTGVDPSGHQLKETMPWKTYARMDDVELAAIYLYLKNLPLAAVSQK